ncbi:MAG TPA: response regulator [Xanthobacteraceae bacterium]|nr:response regulator [Xanthobacteraceae bacterium]
MIPATVFIVEDERVVALHLKQQLLRLGYQVPAMATAGYQALKQIAEHRPDVVLMDIHIEGDIDGIETGARIPDRLQIPIIYLTAYSEEPTLDRARLTKPYGYLLKPFSERELHATIQMALERRRADVLVRDNEQRLGDIVTARTEALAAANREVENQMTEKRKVEQALRQVQKMDVVGQLTAGIAHDFNNLLAVIRGGLELIEAEATRGLTAEPELIEAVQRATRHGSDLVRRLLAFARQMPMRVEPTKVDQLMTDMLRVLRCVLREDIEIVARLDAKGSTILVDRNQLVTTLLNLAVNARDSMPEGGRLAISTTCQRARWAAEEGAGRWPTGDEVCITVRDAGVGMAEEVRDRIFELFFTTKPDGQGAGLGLCMVQRFVEQSGGHIEVDSAAGRGTTISIHLPRIEPVSPTVEHDAITEMPAADTEKFVLLVEDDADVRVVVATQLKHLGYKVHALANGSEAINLIESPATIDAIITDVVLPGDIDGVSLLKEVMHARPTMGVLCISGYEPSLSDRKWLKVQNIELLEKPFCLGQLAKALDIVFGR